MAFIKTDPIARFFSMVDKSNYCWLWTGQLDKRGYGRFWDGTKKVFAHRFSFELVNGDSFKSAGLFICHKCDNPPCVNPEHLFSGTAFDNIVDAYRKGRNPLSTMKLTDEDVEVIKTASGSQREIASIFGISQQTVSDIRVGRRRNGLYGKRS